MQYPLAVSFLKLFSIRLNLIIFCGDKEKATTSLEISKYAEYVSTSLNKVASYSDAYSNDLPAPT
jgi:hypothetical protein